MSSALKVVSTPQELEPMLETMRSRVPEAMTVHDAAIVCNIGRGVLSFAHAAFPTASNTRLYAKHHDREPEGRGAHFDVYDGVADQYHPWIAIYNLAGKATLTAALLPEDLAASYRTRFPEPDDRAYQARRDFSRIALASKDIEVASAEIDAGHGFLLLQRPEGPNVIHNIVPSDKNNPGEFVKFVYPAAVDEAVKKAEADGMQPLDQFLTDRIRTDRTEKEEDNLLRLLHQEEVSLPEFRPMPGVIPPRPDRRRTCNLD